MQNKIYQEEGDLIIKTDRHRFNILFHNGLWFAGSAFIFAALVAIFYMLMGSQSHDYKAVIGVIYLMLWGLIWTRTMWTFILGYLTFEKPITEHFTITKKDSELLIINDPYNTPFFIKQKFRWAFSLSSFYIFTNTGVKLVVNDPMYLNTNVGQQIEVTYYRYSKFVTKLKVIGVTQINNYEEARELAISDYIANKILGGAAKFFGFILLSSALISLLQRLP